MSRLACLGVVLGALAAGAADEVAAPAPEAAGVEFARLHVGASAVGDVVSRQVGAEVAVAVGATPQVDVGASAVVGSAVGARLLAEFHPARAGRLFVPYAQVRAAVHPVPGGVGLGGGLGLGVSLEAWEGRAFAQASAELLHGPTTYLPWAALLSVGYQFDFLRAHAGGTTVVREVIREREVVHERAPAPSADCTISGRVTDLDDKPLAAVVRLPLAPAGLGERAWDASPEFTLRVPPGEYVVEAEAAGYLVRGRKVRVEAGQTLVLDLQLRKLPERRGAVLTDTQVEINQSVQFALNEARLLPESFPILDEVVDVLIRNPAVKKLRIEGHTDQTGTAEYNDELSGNRAGAVKAYLVEKGVAPERLVAVGFGFQRPVASNATEAGRAKNRRVQFVIVERR